jgi:hypothetical protein
MVVARNPTEEVALQRAELGRQGCGVKEKGGSARAAGIWNGDKRV